MLLAQDSFVSTLVPKHAPEGASLFETETMALRVHPCAMVSLSGADDVGCDVADCCRVDDCGANGRTVEGRAMEGL